MRISKLATLIEQADPDKIHVIGDSHAVSIAANIPNTVLLAKRGATLQDIAAQAQSVPDGVPVLVTGGAVDGVRRMQHLAAGATIRKILQGLKARRCVPVYVAHPPVDLNGEYAELYKNAGIDSQYNRVQAETANSAKGVLGQNYVTSIPRTQINKMDPQRIYATPAAYAQIATSSVPVLQKAVQTAQTAPDTQTKVAPDSLQLDTSGLPTEDIPYLDTDGDGVVTMSDAKAAGLPMDTFSSLSGDKYGIFSILSDFVRQSQRIDPNSPSYKEFIRKAKERGLPNKGKPATGLAGNAAKAFTYFKERGFTDEQAAGIVGNLQAESGININPAAIGDGGKAWGIAQWHPERRAIWEKATGKKWESSGISPNFEEQLDFIVYELKRTEAQALRRLRATNTVEDAAAVFDQYYERSSGKARKKRIQLAQAIIGSTGGTQTADASGVPTNGNPLFGMDGASKMTQKDAAAEMQKTLSQYKRMTAMLDFPVKVNDAISKAGTSREQDTPGSQHFHGTALDLSIANLSQDQVKRLLVAAKQVGFTGFGFGNSILHVDRGPRRTWDYGNADFAGLNLTSVKNFATA